MTASFVLIRAPTEKSPGGALGPLDWFEVANMRVAIRLNVKDTLVDLVGLVSDLFVSN